jgi:protein tyrosine kinase modulator
MQELLEQILDYLKGIWIKRRYIIISTWLICPISWYIIAQMPNVYKSEARVYVDTQSLLGPLLRGLTVETDPNTQIRLMVRTLLSRPNLERISRMTDLDVQATNNEEYEQILDDLKENLKISPAGRDNIYTLSIENEDPELAKNIVQSTLTVFIENTLGETRNDSDEAQKFLNTQIREYENRLLEAENRLTAFKQKYSDVSLGPGGSNYYSAVQNEKSKLEQAQLLLSEAKTRLASAKAQLAGEEPSLGLSSSRVETSNRITTTYDGRILQIEENLDGLMLRYTENHPDVKELQRQLESLNEKRDEEIAAYYESIKSGSSASGSNSIDRSPVYQELKIQVSQYENEVASLTVRVDNFRNKLTELQNKIHTLPEIEAELTALNRGYNITKQKYEELLSRKETAELAQQADETTDKIQFRVIDPPRAPTEPTGPARIIFFIVATIFGIGVGVGLSLVMSQINPVVTSTSQLSKMTGIPVFGTVSANSNLGLHSWNRRKTLLFMLSNLILLIVLAMFMSYFLFPDAIQAPLKRIF